ncbi:MAG: preprotein translocase subunit SecA [Patescibacteria group bacterium]|nr:preprotein translocase subunit SecA [Patescibacteria group bacterium]
MPNSVFKVKKIRKSPGAGWHARRLLSSAGLKVSGFVIELRLIVFGFLGNLFDSNEKQLNKLTPVVEEINQLESEIKPLSDEKLQAKTPEFKKRLEKGETLDDLLPEVFAVVREAIRRKQGERAYDVQLMAAISLHQGKAAEQKTGEGKTLTSALTLYLNALEGKGCHMITVNDYLARRDAGWYGQTLHFLGLEIGCIVHDNAFILDPSYVDDSEHDPRLQHLRPVERREAYQADITYGTNNEFGFDYLRDNMAHSFSGMVQTNSNDDVGAHNFAIVDEVDFILIDEARTPLIISAPREEATEKYYEFAKLTEGLVSGTDFEVDEKEKTANLTELGLRKVERKLGVDNLYEQDFETVRHVEQALRARTLFERDVDYIVKEGQVIIVDEFTGRLMLGRRYSEGLHQAIEAKEGVPIRKESQTLATISIQNYFRMYDKLAGMSGTIMTEAEEFKKIYGLDSIAIPTHKPVIRDDRSDLVYKTKSAKWRAVVGEIEECYERGQPVLVGTTSVEKNELVHSLLERKHVPHEILNAKNHQREAEIIAQAGRPKSVTVATNMAGRGVDIKLGGDPVDREEQEQVLDLGGLHVVGTERHEARRIDNQLRGRAGRQGDPGSSQFFVSLEDDLMRIFGGDRVKALMDRFGMEEDVPLEHPMVSGSIERAQKKVEGYNFDIRKHLVEYDDVANVQREIVYKLRRRILSAVENSGGAEGEKRLDWLLEKLESYSDDLPEVWETRREELGETWFEIVKEISLGVVDTFWMEHIDTLTDLREGIGLRGHARRDPLVEYKREARELFEKLMRDIYSNTAERLVRVRISSPDEISAPKMPRRIQLQHEKPELGVRDEKAALSGQPHSSAPGASPAAGGQRKKLKPIEKEEEPGRNDPCPCGATYPDGTPKKYKHCCGR